MTGKLSSALAGFLTLGLLLGPAAASEITNVQDSAAADLDKATRELATLRASAAADLVPLTKELGRLEAELSAKRQQYQEATRLQDTRNLDLENMKTELKLHEDEATYVSNLIDEYARGFEGMTVPGEWPRYEGTVRQVLAAPKDKDLSVPERLTAQVRLLDASIGRIDDVLGGTRYAGEAVSPQGTVQKGKFAAIGPVTLFASDGGETAGLALAQVGSSTPAVRPLGEAEDGEVSKVVSAGSGTFPLDPSRGGALQQLIERGSLVGYFKKGGPIMWPLLAVSILALTVILERLTFLARESRSRDPEIVRDILAHVGKGDIEAAVTTGKSSNDFIARAFTYALSHRDKSFSDALSRAATREVIRYERGISILDTVVTMAPLLGLLGTVTGMMASFGMLGGAELSAPAQITGGIAEALIATAFGLGIAITTLAPLNYLHRRNERARHEVEDAATHLELLVKPHLNQEPQIVAVRASA